MADVLLNHISVLYFFNLCGLYLIGVSFNVAIVTVPAGVPVNGLSNTFDYPILTSVTLMCNATSPDGSPLTGASYSWTATNCYTYAGSVVDPCFYSGGIGQTITGYDLLAQDAGNVTCTATIGGVGFTSNPLTLRISGKKLRHLIKK